MAKVPSERALFGSYKLWRRYADPDGLVSSSEFAEMDEDDKREALRELGGAVDAPAAAGDDEDEDSEETEEEETEDESPDLVDDDDPLGGNSVELTDDIVDPRTLM